MYLVYVSQVSAFAAWLSTWSDDRWPPESSAWTHHPERGADYRLSILIKAYKVGHCFPQATQTLPMARRAPLGAGTSAMIDEQRATDQFKKNR